MSCFTHIELGQKNSTNNKKVIIVMVEQLLIRVDLQAYSRACPSILWEESRYSFLTTFSAYLVSGVLSITLQPKTTNNPNSPHVPTLFILSLVVGSSIASDVALDASR